MTLFGARRASRRTACALLAISSLFGAVRTASADDGLQGFFASMFGGAPQAAAPTAVPPTAAAPRPYAAFRARRPQPQPLVIRLHPSKPRTILAEVPAKVGPVSIYEDRTLRRGDAVMTRGGVRVFAGSASWPYRSADFVALDAGQLDRSTSKVLAQLDNAPRN